MKCYNCPHTLLFANPAPCRFLWLSHKSFSISYLVSLLTPLFHRHIIFLLVLYYLNWQIKLKCICFQFAISLKYWFFFHTWKTVFPWTRLSSNQSHQMVWQKLLLTAKKNESLTYWSNCPSTRNLYIKSKTISDPFNHNHQRIKKLCVDAHIYIYTLITFMKVSRPRIGEQSIVLQCPQYCSENIEICIKNRYSFCQQVPFSSAHPLPFLFFSCTGKRFWPCL